MIMSQPLFLVRCYNELQLDYDAMPAAFKLSRIDADSKCPDAAVVVLRDEFYDTCLQYDLVDYDWNTP